MKKKCLASLLVVIMGTSLLAGCGKGGKSTEGIDKVDNGGVVSLTVWCAEGDTALTQSLIDEFKAENSGTTFEITIENVGESDSRDQILADINNAPDVFSFADDQLSALVGAGALSEVENPDDVKKDNLEGAVSAATINDTIYAYPMTADNGYFLYYNKAVLSESDVASLDQIMSVAAANGAQFSMDWSAWFLYSFFGNTGLELGLNDDGISNFCDWNSQDNAIKGIDVANAMMAISSNPGFKCCGDDDFLAGAKSGNVVAGISGVWLANSLQEAWGDNLAATKLPTYTVNGNQVQMASFAGYKLVGVCDYSSQKEWAHKLAQYLTSEQSQLTRFEQRALGPSNIKASESKEVQESVALQGLSAQAEFSKLQRVGGNYWGPAGDFGTAMYNHDTGGKELQLYLDDMVAEIIAGNGK